MNIYGDVMVRLEGSKRHCIMRIWNGVVYGAKTIW